MAIHFHFQKVVKVPQRVLLKKYIGVLFKDEHRSFDELSIVFCSDEYLLKINQDHLAHDYYTDIITFDLSDPKAEKISGEIYISVDMVNANAEKFNVAFEEELTRVIFHGLLHLVGHKDKSPTDIKNMRKLENYHLVMYRKFKLQQ